MSDEEDNPMSVEYVLQDVEKMMTVQLCDWLKPRLVEEEDRNDAVRQITHHRIKGSDFLKLTIDGWIHNVGLVYAAADSLVKLAQRVKDGGTPENKLDYDIVRFAGENSLNLIKALGCIVEDVGNLPGNAFWNRSRPRDISWDYILTKMKNDCKVLTTVEEDITSNLLMKVYESMVVNNTFCLARYRECFGEDPSEMFIGACLGFLCIDFVLLRYSKCFHSGSPLKYNKNTEWIPPHFFWNGTINEYYNWKPKCDGALSFRPSDDKHFDCLLVCVEHSRMNDNKDCRKICDLLTASAETILQIVDDPEWNPFFLFSFSLQNFILYLRVMEVNPKLKRCYYAEKVKTFDCTKGEEYHEAINCCWTVAKYALGLANEIGRLSGHFTQYRSLGGWMNNRKPNWSSCSGQPSSFQLSTSSQSRRKQKSETKGSHHAAQLAEVKHVLSSSGEFFAVKPMFETSVVSPRLGRILFAAYGDTREAVIVKNVSPSEFDYVKKLKANVHSWIKSPQSIGFLFPESFKDFGGFMKFLVFKKVRPLSSLYFDDLGLVEKIYNQLVKFMKFCQAHQIVHGDLKLSNLGLDKENLLCVFDWEEHVDGTQGYMAPEVASRSTKPNALSDIYSAGILLQEIVDKIGRLEEMDQDRLQRLRLAISSMLAREPEKRELVDLESTKLTRSDTWSASEESGSSDSFMPEKRPRMADLCHANGDGYNML